MKYYDIGLKDDSPKKLKLSHYLLTLVPMESDSEVLRSTTQFLSFTALQHSPDQLKSTGTCFKIQV